MIVRNSGPHVEKLQDRIAELEEENADLKRILGVGHEHEGLRLLGLTEQQANLIGVLLKREIASSSLLMTAAHPSDLDRRYSMTARSVKVPLSHARKRLPRGVEIECVHSRGYRIPPASKAKLIAAIRGVESRAMNGG